MKKRRGYAWVVLAWLCAAGAMAPASAAMFSAAQTAPPTLDLRYDEGRRLFDQLEYDKAKAVFDQVITALLSDPASLKPDLLAQAYALRAQARFALGDQAGADQDLVALLRVSPGYRLAASAFPRVVAMFDSARTRTVGHVSVSLAPAGDVQIDGRPYTLQPEPQAIDVVAGEHQVMASRAGYESATQKFTVAAGETVTLSIVLARTSATLEVTSIPEDVEVIFDGQRRGVTRKGSGAAPESAPLVLSDLAPGVHQLQLKRACFVTVERQITIDRPADMRVGPLQMLPAVATVKVEAGQPGAAVLLDGAVKGQAPMVLSDLCEGLHAIEVRASSGRFVDRREWKAGDAATLTASLRGAFPIVAVNTPAGRSPAALRTEVERALANTRNVLVYALASGEQQTVDAEPVPAGWLSADPGSRTPRDATREFGRTLAAKLDAQGVAVVSIGADPSVARVAILASGSAEPDVLLVNLTDAAVRARLLDTLAAPLAPVLTPSIGTALVDVAGVRGAVVVRPGGAGAKAGLAGGDTIVGAGDGPVVSVAELRSRIAAVRPPAMDLSLDVKGAAGTARKITVAVAMMADASQLRDPAAWPNLALVDLQRALTTAAPADRQGVLLNLAIVQMRLSNWTEAEALLAPLQMPAERGVSAGTIAYLRGRCFEELGRIAEAQSAYASAAAAGDARLWIDGPLVAPLAQQKLQAR